LVFETQTKNPPKPQLSVLMPKPKNRLTNFEVKPREIITTDFKAKLKKTVTTGFDANRRKLSPPILRSN
jgi:hypothetical protein